MGKIIIEKALLQWLHKYPELSLEQLKTKSGLETKEFLELLYKCLNELITRNIDNQGHTKNGKIAATIVSYLDMHHYYNENPNFSNFKKSIRFVYKDEKRQKTITGLELLSQLITFLQKNDYNQIYQFIEEHIKEIQEFSFIEVMVNWYIYSVAQNSSETKLTYLENILQIQMSSLTKIEDLDRILYLVEQNINKFQHIKRDLKKQNRVTTFLEKTIHVPRKKISFYYNKKQRKQYTIKASDYDYIDWKFLRIIDSNHTSEILDWREKAIISIDSSSQTACLDDAYSYTKLENGNIELGIYISDVAHFVKFGSLLDRMAFDYMQTVYPSDKKIKPYNMFPKSYCYSELSLLENQQRRVLAFTFEITPNYRVLSYSVNQALIHIKKNYFLDSVTPMDVARLGKYQILATGLNANKRVEIGGVVAVLKEFLEKNLYYYFLENKYPSLFYLPHKDSGFQSRLLRNESFNSIVGNTSPIRKYHALILQKLIIKFMVEKKQFHTSDLVRIQSELSHLTKYLNGNIACFEKILK